MDLLRRFLAATAFISLVAGLALALADPALAQKRVALVVGNNAYPHFPADKQLTTAIGDARAMRDALQGLGFEVLYGENLDRRTLVDRLFDLAARLNKDDTALFYFAGHGVSFSGANYILPSDLPVPRATGRAEEGRLADQAVAETSVIERITANGARVTIMVLDACRDNPLQAADRRSVGTTRGLAAMQPARGVFSIYSAGFGQAALDRLGPNDRHPNSVFTRVFIDKLRTPGLDLKALAAQTRNAVVDLAQKVGHDQVPAYYDQVIGGDIYLAGLPAAGARDPRPAAAPERRIALLIGNADYAHVEKLKNPRNDVDAVARALRQANFTSVRVETDLTLDRMRAALRRFAAEAAAADWAVVYFAGSGFLKDATTYLLETDAKMSGASDIRNLGMTMDDLLGSVRGARKLRLAIVNVCQDDPVDHATLAASSAHPVPSGLLAFVSSSPGQVARDGAGALSPFATALVNRLATPGLDLSQIFRLVREDVLAATDRQQEPRVFGTPPDANLVVSAPR